MQDPWWRPVEARRGAALGRSGTGMRLEGRVPPLSTCRIEMDPHVGIRTVSSRRARGLCPHSACTCRPEFSRSAPSGEDQAMVGRRRRRISRLPARTAPTPTTASSSTSAPVKGRLVVEAWAGLAVPGANVAGN